jgi:Uma2 family endonuclease
MELATAITEPRAEPQARTGRVPYRLSVDQYLRMIDLGFFPDKARVELLDGRLFRKMTIKPPHCAAVEILAHLLKTTLLAGWIAREEKPLFLGRSSLPEPDIAVVRGYYRDFWNRPPAASETVIVIEVADSSYAQDRGMKWRLYAEAGIPQYGILNLSRRQFELYSEPARKGKLAGYRKRRIYDETASFVLTAHGIELVEIVVEDYLPQSSPVEQSEPPMPTE